MDRSVSVDIDLEPGTYSVLMKITAKRNSAKATVEQVIRDSCRDRQDKLIQIGLAYDLAHAKGQIKETEGEKKVREEREAKKKAADHRKDREVLRAKWLKNWEVGRKRNARQKRYNKRKEEHLKKIEARKVAAAKEQDQIEGADPDEAGKNKTEAAGQAEKEDSPGTTETVKEDTPATTDEAPGESKPDAAKSDETKPEETQAPETKVEEPQCKSAPEFDKTKPQDKPASDETVGASVTAGTDITDNARKEAEGITIGKEDGVVTITADSKEAKTAEPQSSEETTDKDKAAQFEAALLQVPSDINNGAADTVPANDTAPPPSAAALDDDWEHDSLASFASSIVTELDFPTDPPAVGEPAPLPLNPDNPEEEDENAEFENDPWNAVCVVGLRVYSKDEGLSVSIIRPKNEVDEDTPLDLDDNSKGASGETTKDGVSTGETSQDKIETEVKEGAEPEIIEKKDGAEHTEKRT